MKPFFSFIFCFLSIFCYAENNWIVYGATIVKPYSNIDNPQPNVNGLVGEVISLPYRVPDNKQLVITNYAIEGGKSPQYALIPWIGSQPITNDKCIMTCAAAYGSNLYNGMKWILPSGTILNVRISNSSNDGFAYAFGWYLEGYLQPNP